MRVLVKAMGLLAAAQLAAVGQESSGESVKMALVPSRVVFEEGQPDAELTLFNRGSAAAWFQQTFQHFDMDEGGRLHEHRPADATALERMLVVTPSRSLLQPGESQVFRIHLRKPAGLAQGEYRVHLTFRASQEAEEAVASVSPSRAELEVRTRTGLAVPVIVRHGTRGVRVAIRDLALVPGKSPSLALALCREGDESAYGDLSVLLLDGAGEGRVIATLPGVAVYPSLARRMVRIPLPGAVLPGSRLKAVFTAKDQALRAEAELVVEEAR